MLKKASSLLLAVLFLCCIKVSAFAEIGYTLIKETISNTIDDGFSLTMDTLPHENIIVISYSLTDNTVLLLGKNSNNKPEGTMWSFDSTSMTMAHFILFCSQWDTLSSLLDSGYDLYLIMRTDESDVLIDSAEKAEFVVSAFSESFGISFDSFTNSEDTPAISKSTIAATIGESNALKSAQSYLSHMSFSYSGLIDQLEYEGYTTAEATYAANNCGADWNEQAAKSAASYLSHMSFSRSGLIEQLEYEGFTHEQAVYGVEQNG